MIRCFFIALFIPLAAILELLVQTEDFKTKSWIESLYPSLILSDPVLQAATMLRQILGLDITESHLKACFRGGFALKIETHSAQIDFGEIIPTECYTDLVFSRTGQSYTKVLNFPSRLRVDFFRKRTIPDYRRSAPCHRSNSNPT